MKTVLYAQPYDQSATGFSFETIDQFTTRSSALLNQHGQPVEEFDIQFIDGEAVDAELARAMGLNQANIGAFLEGVETWDDYEKHILIIALLDLGYRWTPKTQPSDFEIDIYDVRTLHDLAVQFVDDGLFGDIPPRLQFYIDYDAIARDLAVDYSETEIAGAHLIYRAA